MSLQDFADRMTPGEVAILFALVSVIVVALVVPYLSRLRRARDFATRSAELRRLQDL